MKRTILLLLVLGIITGIAFIGCSDDDSGTLDPKNKLNVVIASISPMDGATGISTSTSIVIKFTGPVDTLSVMENMYLAGGQSMHEWRDSLTHYGGFGMMNMNMENHMMSWMDSIETSGMFSWNSTHDSCQFIPDSILMGSTEYLCLLVEGAMEDTHGGMMGGATHNDNGYHMYGFTTSP